MAEKHIVNESIDNDVLRIAEILRVKKPKKNKTDYIKFWSAYEMIASDIWWWEWQIIDAYSRIHNKDAEKIEVKIIFKRKPQE